MIHSREDLAIALADLCDVIGRRESELRHHEPGSVIHEAAVAALRSYQPELAYLLTWKEPETK